MEYDLTDYSQYLQYEREEELRQALREEVPQVDPDDSILLEVEVKFMMEML